MVAAPARLARRSIYARAGAYFCDMWSYLDGRTLAGCTHPTVTTPISAEVARIEKYKWERRVICPSLHLGCPVKRPRMVWIGVREQ